MKIEKKQLHAHSMKNQRLIGLFFLAFLLFNFPFLKLIKPVLFISGIPTMFLYMFFVWAVLIFFMFLIIEFRSIIPVKDNDEKMIQKENKK